MGKYPTKAVNTVKLVDHLLQVSGVYVANLQRYLFRFIELKNITYEMMKELPPERQSYYTERIAGIDTRIRSIYHGTQGDANGTTKPVSL